MKSWLESYVPPGDPRKGMEAVYKLASLEDPPLHFPLSKMTLETYKAKGTLLLETAEKYASGRTTWIRPVSDTTTYYVCHRA